MAADRAVTADSDVGRLARPGGRTLVRTRPRLLGEVAVVVGLLVVYDRVRSMVSVHPSVAVSHGRAILHAESALNVEVEHAVNAWLTEHAALATLAVGYYQFLHLAAALTILAVCYRYRPVVYRPARNALVLTNVVGLAVFALYPTAPPRLLPGAGFVDTVADVGFGTDHGPIPADQYGALPSLHLAWATWVAVAGFAMTRRRLLRAGLVAHPLLTGLAVVATANHYVLDVASGMLLGVVAAWTTGLLALAVRRPDRRRRRSAQRPAQAAAGPASYTVVAFHAHPDDETLLTGGTLARLAAEGHRVVIVVATLGEAGLTDAAHGRDSPLGERRRLELRSAATALGCQAVTCLGYADSGLNGSAPDRAFSRADVDAAAERLAGILRHERADVLTVYDPAGGYGHPDHVQVHAVGHRAATLAGTRLVLEATVNRHALLRVANLLRLVPGLPPGFRPARLRESFSPPARLTHRVDVRDHLDAKRAAMTAHASQRTGGTAPRSLAVYLRLPAPLFRLVFGHEWYVEAGRQPGRPLLDDVLTTLRGDAP
jgi:LmbE family N-acetylglucosaminyl deacetylase/membrane-associated phospholipid phosphatase